jgi:hypothetical protein
MKASTDVALYLEKSPDYYSSSGGGRMDSGLPRTS